MRWLKDPSTKEESIHATAFFIGFIVVIAKLILSGTKIGGMVMAQFSGMDFAAAMGALGSVFSLHSYVSYNSSNYIPPLTNKPPEPPINLPKDL